MAQELPAEVEKLRNRLQEALAPYIGEPLTPEQLQSIKRVLSEQLRAFNTLQRYLHMPGPLKVTANGDRLEGTITIKGGSNMGVPVQESILLPYGVSVGEISDGYHTFDELYEHRCYLFLALMAHHPGGAWVTQNDQTGEHMGSWFLAGLNLKTGPITYHIPTRLYGSVPESAEVLDKAPPWDGHVSEDVIRRLRAELAGRTDRVETLKEIDADAE